MRSLRAAVCQISSRHLGESPRFTCVRHAGAAAKFEFSSRSWTSRQCSFQQRLSGRFRIARRIGFVKMRAYHGSGLQ